MMIEQRAWNIVKLHCCLQEEREVEKAIEQMLSAVTTLNSVHRATPLPASAVGQLSDIYRQIEMLINAT